MGQCSGALERAARYPAHTLLRAPPGPCSLPLAQKASHTPFLPHLRQLQLHPQRRSEAFPVPGAGAGGQRSKSLLSSGFAVQLKIWSLAE